jgi:hypothetical protein
MTPLFLLACAHPVPPAAPAAAATRPALPITEGLAVAPAGACGPFEALGETAVYPALGGRLRLSLPVDAVAETDPDPAPRQTRFLVQRGESKLIVMVFETYGAATDGLAEIVAENEASQGTVARVKLASGLAGAIVEPTERAGPKGGVLVSSGYFNGPDGTVANVAVLASEDVAPTTAACQAMARQILTSVAPGDVHLDLAAGDRTVGGYQISLPDNYVLANEPGPDFDLWRVFPVTAMDQPTPQLGLYFGRAPAFQPVGTEAPGELLGEPITWFTNEQAGWTNVGALLAASDDGDMVHVFVSAPTAAGAKALVRVAETLRRAP